MFDHFDLRLGNRTFSGPAPECVRFFLSLDFVFCSSYRSDPVVGAFLSLSFFISFEEISVSSLHVLVSEPFIILWWNFLPKLIPFFLRYCSFFIHFDINPNLLV